MEPFEHIHGLSRDLEHLEVDDILLGALALPIVLAWLSWRRSQDWQRETKRRRAAERQLREARDYLEQEVDARTWDLRQASELAQANHTRLVEAIEAIGDGFCLYDANDRLVMCNSVFLDELGEYAHIATPGRKFADILPAIVGAHGLPVGVTNEAAWIKERVEQHQNPPAEPMERRRRDGRWFRLMERRTADGGLVGFYADITERKQRAKALKKSEQQLRLITDSLPVLIAYIDANGCVQFINKTGRHWYGRPQEKIIGYPIAEILDGESVVVLRPLWNQALAGEYVNGEYSITYNDGNTRTVDLVYVPHWDEDGQVIGFFGLVEDITARKGTEEQLRQSQKLEAVGRLTGGIAHDFNNLLGVVLGSLELLGDFLDERPEEKRLTDNAARAAMRGAELTQRLLAFSRKQELSPQAIDPAKFLPNAAELLRRTINQTIEIRPVVSDDVWRAVADPGQLETAILNLAINARDAMPDGGTLTIEAANATLDPEYAARHDDVTPGDYLMIAVSDTGTGMAPEVIDQAFEPFFTTKEVGKGTGLGLSMVFGFVKQSGGHISIYSEVGHGTSIKLYLPRPSDDMLAAYQPGAAPNVMPLGHETVLVVEDNVELQQLATAALKKLGYQVLEATTGREALATLETTPQVDLVFSDMVLPEGMNGVDLAQAVLAQRPGVKVLLTTGYTEQKTTDFDPAQSFEVLAKPYRRQDLAHRVRALLDDPAPTEPQSTS